MPQETGFGISRRALRALLLGSMSISLLVPFLVLGWLNYRSSREWAREEIRTSGLPLTRDNIYSEIHARLVQPLYVSTTMANDAFLKEWAAAGEENPERVVRYLRQIRDKYGFFSVFFVSARTRKYYHFKGLHKVVDREDEHDDWFFRFIGLQREYELDVDTDEAGNNELTIFINFRVEGDGGELLGVTGVGMKMDTVARLLRETESRYGRRIYLVDRTGLVQAHIDRVLIETANIRSLPGLRTVAGSILGSLDSVTNAEYETETGRVYLTARFIPELDWFLVVEENESPALESARDNFLRTMLFGGAIWLLLVAASLWLANRFHARMETVARTDPLTGLGNRRRFEEDFAVARARHARDVTPFALLLIDLDGFKKVNDRFGHLAGDELLKAAAGAMRRATRPTDCLARWGGDEFAALSFCTLSEAVEIAGRLRIACRDAARGLAEDGADDPRAHVGISCGVAEYRPGMDLDTLVHRADELLYEAKNESGDAVRSAAADGTPDAKEPS